MSSEAQERYIAAHAALDHALREYVRRPPRDLREFLKVLVDAIATLSKAESALRLELLQRRALEECTPPEAGPN